ncbi:hypothetical protein Leryth_008445 [Lithospermum erythrorhizon]|nr:hypothetical protein Leryth_008445 [Lithospermum erythrorhizon]
MPLPFVTTMLVHIICFLVISGWKKGISIDQLDGSTSVHATGIWFSGLLDMAKGTRRRIGSRRCKVKGWTVVKPARDYLNSKNRCCMHNCKFKVDLQASEVHVKSLLHPSLQSMHKVDPLLEQKWSRLEHEREREDVISTITSSMPGAVVFGDYVIERNHVRFESDEEDGFDADAMDRIEGFDVGIDQIESNFMNVFLLLQAFDSARNNRDPRRHGRDRNRTLDGSTIGFDDASTIGGFDNFELTDTDDDGRGNQGNTIVDRLQREGRIFLPRGGRRRRRREPHGSRRGVDRLIGE